MDATALTTTGTKRRAAYGPSGTAKDGVIEVQGDDVAHVMSWLTWAGHPGKRAVG